MGITPIDGEARVMLITGASSGIGEATARRAAAAGIRVVLAARRIDRLESLTAELGGDAVAIAVRCDVSSFPDCETAVSTALDAFGRLDVMFANAGAGSKGQGWFVETPEDWREQVNVNVLGTAYATRAAIPALRETKGHLVITGSLSGLRALPGSMYSCTKHAVTVMAEALRLELNGTGVHVAIVHPGIVDTPILWPSGYETPDWALEPDDIARAVMYVVAQPSDVDVSQVVVRPIEKSQAVVGQTAKPA